MAAHEQKVIQPYNPPDIHRINSDLQRLYNMPLDHIPIGIRWVLWYTWWQSQHPASTPEYRVMMGKLGTWAEQAAEQVIELLEENQAMAQALADAGISMDEVRKLAKTGS